ncbi:RNA polymerase sigma factor [Chryseobacterium viscerum]|uniref:RNA polymerase sigma factor n=1 Tax=Chryseobacterium viscerum TaxID=1037377 RepID=UPI001401DB59|nr:sigma-70 family RNA polymerase sigma factor [Chryseobacterium viscerum]
MTFFKKHIIEKSSFEGLYYHYNHQIFTCISRSIENRDDVMDVMQEVYIHLWEYREKLLAENAESIIFNTCKQKISKFYRTTNRQPFFEEMASDYADPSPEELKSVNKKEQHLYELEKSVKLIIPPLRRKIFTMNKLEGIIQEEIAVRLNIPKSTVKHHLSEAMLFLKNHHKNP